MRGDTNIDPGCEGNHLRVVQLRNGSLNTPFLARLEVHADHADAHDRMPNSQCFEFYWFVTRADGRVARPELTGRFQCAWNICAQEFAQQILRRARRSGIRASCASAMAGNPATW